MAGFEGWWVNGKTGVGRHVAEHWMEVRSDPESFGVSEDEVAKILKAAGGEFNPGDTSPDGARGLLLKAAMKNDWVRVRGYQGKYSIQTYGHMADLLPKVLQFLKRSGVRSNSTILLSDLASTFHQTFVDGMAEIHRALKQGKIANVDPPKERIKDLRTDIGLTDKQQRVLMRQQLGQQTHVPDPDPSDDKIEERHALKKGLAKILG